MYIFFFQAEDGIRDWSVTGVQTCALPISKSTGLVRNPSAASAANCSCSASDAVRSEERRVGKECRSRWSTYQSKKKEEKRGNERAENRLRLQRTKGQQ